ncbi:GATA zinc finger domain-containing protein 11-like [Mercenaria mercenaria]|uniref:GATA zinc finger domain-containing protein 11-like n=1 Tax=Mercenaria mercenaria TaxID=6596 RepID=UPI00234F48ED|nr:GATA zinc finger domain-containing protein 11-like [Mercenaria mercenaria]
MAVLVFLFLPFLYLTVYKVHGLPDGTCYYNNTIYRPGDEFPAKDGCNNCTCHYSFVTCTKCLCLQPEVGKRFISTNNNNNNNINNNNNNNVNINYNTVVTSNVITAASTVTCNVNGVVYRHAQGYISTDGCTKCSCTQTGMACSSLTCLGHQPVQKDYHKCKYSGTTYNFGDSFYHTDGCNKCVCGLNTIECTDAAACKPTTPAYDCTYVHNNDNNNNGTLYMRVVWEILP